MSNPTTPFGWQMPENTDLVTDLPADFEVFGQAVATDLQYLLGGTTGQVLAKASGTDLDFDWVTDATGMTNPMTTTSDMIYSSSGSTPARIGIGSSGQVMTVTAGVPGWAAGGGMTLLTTHTLSGATSAITGISGDYVNLFALIFGTTNATSNGYLKVAPNGNNSISDFSITQGGSIAAVTDTLIPLANLAQTMDRTDVDNIFSLTIFGYASTTARKTFQTQMGYIDVNASGRFGTAIGYIKTNSAITSLTFSNTGGNLSAGTVLLYGVK